MVNNTRRSSKPNRKNAPSKRPPISPQGKPKRRDSGANANNNYKQDTASVSSTTSPSSSPSSHHQHASSSSSRASSHHHHNSNSTGKCKTIGNISIDGAMLGKGAYARIYLGTHVLSGENVAVKVVDHAKAHASKNEISALSELQHPNIVRLYAHANDNQHDYLLLEYVAGDDLGKRLESRGSLSEEEAKQLFKQLVDVMVYCHSKSIAHHDIKPQNLILDLSKKLKLIDFGLAVYQPNPQELCEVFSGSPLYMAVEVLNQLPYNPFVADIWSMGILLYELLCNELPWNATTLEELVEQVSFQEWKLPEDVALSPQLVDLLQRLLVKDPTQRITLEEILIHPWMVSASA